MLQTTCYLSNWLLIIPMIIISQGKLIIRKCFKWRYYLSGFIPQKLKIWLDGLHLRRWKSNGANWAIVCNNTLPLTINLLFRVGCLWFSSFHLECTCSYLLIRKKNSQNTMWLAWQDNLLFDKKDMFRYITAMVLQSEAIQTTVTLQNLSSLQNSGLSPL